MGYRPCSKFSTSLFETVGFLLVVLKRFSRRVLCNFPIVIAGNNVSGTIQLPAEARAFLELNTAVHAIARERTSSSSSSVPSPAAGVTVSRQDCEVEVEPLTLEVCLFDNARRSSSPLAPPSSSALLGLGTAVLTPIIFASTQQDENRGISRREVLLYEPGTGKTIASALLGMTFSASSHSSSYGDDVPIPTESPRIADATNNTYRTRLRKVRDSVRGVNRCPRISISDRR